MHFFRTFIIIVIIACGITNESNAKNISDNKAAFTPKEPVNITADQLLYHKKTSITQATGNVEIEQNNQLIFADNVTYDSAQDVIYAYGNVSLLREDGSIFFSDEMIFNSNEFQGIAINFKARMPKNTLLAARKAEILDKNTTQLSDLTYSPCKVCEHNFIKNTPLWQFRSKKAIMSSDEESIRYEDATLDVFGKPVMYLPYLATPAPGANRRSGFLIPRISQSSKQLGFGVKVPYYFNIAKNMDATFSPAFYSNASDLFAGEFRHLTTLGKYKINAGVSYSRNRFLDTSDGNISKSPFEGYFNVNADLKLRNYKGYSEQVFIDSYRVFDKAKTFLKKYKISNEQILNTDINYIIKKDKEWYSARMLSFQDLRPDHNNKTTAAAYPMIDFYRRWDTGVYGTELTTELNYLNLFRPQGVNYNRVVTKLVVSKNFHNLPMGQLFKISADFRADAYQVDLKPIVVQDTLQSNDGIKEGFESRYHPELILDWSLPLLNKEIPSTTLVIEPVINVIFSPNTNDLSNNINEDSQLPEISSSTIFESNRYKGLDKIEVGNRLNYGIRANISNQHLFKNMFILLGHNIRSKADPNFTTKSGLDGHRSDFVGKVSLQYNDDIFIHNNARIADDKLSLQRNEVNMAAKYKKWKIHLSHFYISGDLLDNNENRFKQQLVTDLEYNIYKQFYIDGGLNTRIGKKPPDQNSRKINDKVGFIYKGDCLHVRFGIERDHTSLIDLKPETSYTVTVNIPNF